MTTVLEDPITVVVLSHYRIGLEGKTDAELQEAAATAEVLPGEVGALMRHLVDEEFEFRRAARRAPSCARTGCQFCAPATFGGLL